MAARKAKKDDAQEKAQKHFDDLMGQTVMVNAVEFKLAEFTEETAEFYDTYYRDNGGQQLDLKRRTLQAEEEKLPKSTIIDVLNKKIIPLRKELRDLEKSYQAEPTEEVFDRMLELAAEIDPLEDRARKAVQYTDYEKVMPEVARIEKAVEQLNDDLLNLRLNFCHALATRNGQTAETLERWQERATEADRRAAVDFVGKARRYLALGRALNPPSEPKTTPSANAESLPN